MTKALREESLDVAIVLTEGIVADIIKGNPSKIVKTYVQSPLIWGIHVADHSTIQTEADIEGSTYAISRLGSGSHLMAIVDAVSRGWDPKEMNFELVKNLEGARESLANDQADVFFWERFMTQPYVDNGEFRRIGEVLTPWPCFVVSAREAVLEDHAGEIRSMLTIVNEIARSLSQSPDSAALIARTYGLQEPDVHTWLSKTKWDTTLDLNQDMIGRVIQSLYQAGILDHPHGAPEDLLFSLK